MEMRSAEDVIIQVIQSDTKCIDVDVALTEIECDELLTYIENTENVCIFQSELEHTTYIIIDYNCSIYEVKVSITCSGTLMSVRKVVPRCVE